MFYAFEIREPLLETDPTRMCELLVGLDDVAVLGVADESDGPLHLAIETRLGGPPPCGGCGGVAELKERVWVSFVDLPVFGRPTRLRWRKRRWRCVDSTCPVGSWTETAPAIAAARQVITTRAGRWATTQVGRRGRTVNEIAQVRWAALDLSGAYRSTFDTVLPDATQVADPFHVVKLANEKLDECRRRVQNQTLGHRGRKEDPLYRARRLLVMADERVDDRGRQRLRGLLRAGDPNGEVYDTWIAKECVRDIYTHHDPDTAHAWVTRLADDLQLERPPEVQSLDRTLRKWAGHITAWHRSGITNAATEGANNLIKRIKRIGSGFRSFRNYRTRILLYAGRPNWDLLDTVTPAEIR